MTPPEDIPVLMSEAQKAAFHLGYLKALTDLLEVSRKNPILNQEHLIRAINLEAQRMKRESSDTSLQIPN